MDSMHRHWISVPTRRSANVVVALILLSTFGCAPGWPTHDGPPAETNPAISPIDLAAHIRALTDDRMEGRRVGTSGEHIASDYLIRAMRRIGLQPAGENGDYRHAFDFTAGISLGSRNQLIAHITNTATNITPNIANIDDIDSIVAVTLEVGADWRPLAFSGSGEIPPSPLVFAGYGLVAPAQGDIGALDAYANLEIADRWVIVFRGLPPSARFAMKYGVQKPLEPKECKQG